MKTWVKKGMKIIRIFSCAGVETGAIVTVVSVKKGKIECDDSDVVKYDATTLCEVEPCSGMASSRLVQLTGAV